LTHTQPLAEHDDVRQGQAADGGLVSTVEEAARVLVSAPRWPISELAHYLEPVPGLYAVFGTDTAWKQLGLSPSNGAGPLYVGKAEESFVSRDLRTHFSSGKTGQSTIRRSFAALLRDSVGFRGVPRNPERPGHFANYGLTIGDDAKLTEWMWGRLSLAVWPARPGSALKKVERGVVILLDPPLNIEYLPRPTRRDLSSARKAMADDARRWTSDRALGGG
jgi:hypothetical protein